MTEKGGTAALRVLYVEDNLQDQDLARECLKGANPPIRLECVGTARQCWAQLATRTYDLVLIDYNLPDEDGLEILHEIIRRKLDVPAIIVTGGGDEELAVEALRSGAVDYLPKHGPYLDELPTLIRTGIAEHARRRAHGALYPERGLEVLYVEHGDADIDLTLSRLGETAPHISLTVSRSSTEALEMLPGGRDFDLVLTDLRMPGITGLELIRAARLKGSKVPFVVVTGMGDETAAVAALKLGALDYLVKRNGYLDQLPYVLEHALLRHKSQMLSERLARELEDANRSLEEKVRARTVQLAEEIEERRRADEDVRRLNLELESRIAERTAELRMAVSQMAGRETRMAELKEAIRALQRQLAEAGMKPAAGDPLGEDPAGP